MRSRNITIAALVMTSLGLVTGCSSIATSHDAANGIASGANLGSNTVGAHTIHAASDVKSGGTLHRTTGGSTTTGTTTAPVKHGKPVVTEAAYTTGAATWTASASQTAKTAAAVNSLTGTFFSSSSTFNTQISGTSVDANSAGMVSALTSSTPIADMVTYGVPIYNATSASTKHSVTCTENWGTCPFAGLSIPLDASYKPSAGSDGAMVVVDKSKGLAYEFWQAKRLDSGAWTTSWGSVVSLNGNGWNGVSTASGASRVAGVVLLSEIKAGVINHALVVQSNMTCANTFRAPALKTDGWSTAWNCIPEGARVQLDPSVDVSKLTGAQHTIAVALQKYGAYVVDSGGASMSVSFQVAPDASGLFPGSTYSAAGLTQDYQAMSQIPWNKLRVLSN